jgi:hypothetical protein
MECLPREDPSILVATGHWLPLHHQIRIVQRYVNHKYQPTDPNESYIPISMLKLDKSYNGKMDDIVMTSAQQIGQLYKETIQGISSNQKGDDTKKNNHPKITNTLQKQRHPKNAISSSSSTKDESAATTNVETKIASKSKKRKRN